MIVRIVRIVGYWGCQQGEILTDVRIMGSLRGRSKEILMVVRICRGQMPDGRPSGGIGPGYGLLTTGCGCCTGFPRSRPTMAGYRASDRLKDPLQKSCGTLVSMLGRSSALPFAANSAAVADKWRLLAHPDPGPKALADFCRGSQALHYCADAHRTGPPGLVREPLLLPDRSAVFLQGPGSCRCGCTGSPAGMLCFPEFCHRTGPGKPVPPPVSSGPPCRHCRFSPPTPRAFVDIGRTVCRPCACRYQ